ncbi:hypothetical protein HGB13_02365 [bacterium]|nr:hypothetical protein [bacterium]
MNFILGEKDTAYTLLNRISGAEAVLQKSIYNFIEEKYDEALSDKKNLEDINNVYTKTILKKTENTDFYKIATAEALNEINQPYFAKIILNKMIAENKNYRDVYLYLGNSFLIQNDIDNAYKILNIAKDKDPIYGLTYFLLAQTNFKDNKHDEGNKNLELAKKYGFITN